MGGGLNGTLDLIGSGNWWETGINGRRAFANAIRGCFTLLKASELRFVKFSRVYKYWTTSTKSSKKTFVQG